MENFSGGTLTLVEQIARALIARHAPALSEYPWSVLKDSSYAVDACAVLEAMREPTEAMIDAYFARCQYFGFYAHITATAAWSAMIEAEITRLCEVKA